MLVNIGILLNRSDIEQAPYHAILEANKLHVESTETNVTLFVRDITTNLMNFSGCKTSLDKCFHSNAHMISTSISLASYALRGYNTTLKFLYLHEIEWWFGGDYLTNCEILLNPELHVICPSEDYRKELKNYCGKESVVIPNFNLKEIINEIKRVARTTDSEMVQ